MGQIVIQDWVGKYGDTIGKYMKNDYPIVITQWGVKWNKEPVSGQ